MLIKYMFIFSILILISGCGTQIFQTVNTTQVTVANETNINLPDSGNFDAFQRMRVSNINSLIDIKMLHDNKPQLIDEVVFSNFGSAVSRYNVNQSSNSLIVSNEGDYVIRQTKQVTNYQAGKSHQILLTFDNMQPQTNIIKRIGYFSSSTVEPYTENYDGLYLESSNGEISINIANNGEITQIKQSNFNVDRLDGTGVSGINIDWSKSHILAIDFQWLGVGRVRWSLVIDGVVIPFHYSNHVNNIQGVYMRFPNQPLRWEIRQTGEGSGELTQICSSVGSEGSLNLLGIVKSYDTGSTPFSASTVGTRYALLTLKYNDEYSNTQVDINSFNLLITSNNNVRWEIVLNPNIAGTLNYQSCDFCYLHFARGQTENTVTGGIVLYSGYVDRQAQFSEILSSSLKMGRFINGTSDVVSLVVTPLQQNVNVFGAMEVLELR